MTERAIYSGMKFAGRIKPVTGKRWQADRWDDHDGRMVRVGVFDTAAEATAAVLRKELA